MDVARLNFSHGDHPDHQANYERVREASNATGKAVGILADLQGPKIRLGRFAEGKTNWATGESVRITVDECEGTHDRVSTTYKELAQDASEGDRLLVDDGKVGLVVTGVEGNDVVCRVTEGGPVSNNKGLSLPGMNVSVPAMSGKDIADLEFALALGVDFIALSFVRSPADIELVHAIMDRVGRRVPVIAKLEKPEAVDNLEAIVLAFDAVMLSGETSVGKYVMETVRTMARIVETVETEGDRVPPLPHVPRTKRGVISYAARDIGERLNAKALVAFTSSGDTVRRLARLHTSLPLLAFTSIPEVRSQLALSWGTETFLVPEVATTDAMVLEVDKALLQLGRYSKGDQVVIVAGAPPGTVGSTNLIHVHRIGEEDR